MEKRTILSRDAWFFTVTSAFPFPTGLESWYALIISSVSFHTDFYHDFNLCRWCIRTKSHMSLKCLPISSLHFMRLRRNRPRYSSKIYFLFILPFLLPVKHMGTSKFMRLFSFMQIDGIKSLISLISLSSHQKMKSVTRSFVEPLAKHLYLECSSNGSVYSLYISCNKFLVSAR